jgi:fluoride exporter
MVACGDPSGTAERVWNDSVACRHAAEGRRLATLAGCYLWRDGHARALRPPGSRAPSRGQRFPYGTLLVNLTGCFFLGLIGQFTMNRMVLPADWRMAITVGFFGGYTTFSSFGWETAKMLEDGEWLGATAYVGASVLAGLLLSVAGIRLANKF